MKREYNDGILHATLFIYNASGQLIAEYNSDPVPPPQGGGGTSYLTTDHLGSTRVVTNSSGVVKARYDYLPFGEEIGAPIGGRTAAMGYGGADSTRQKFTQEERDSESRLDYFLARYYSSAHGRFTSADSHAGSTGLPQTLNLYAYTANNPLRYLDPTGNFIVEKSPFDDLGGVSAPTSQPGTDWIGSIVEGMIATLNQQARREQHVALDSTLTVTSSIAERQNSEAYNANSTMIVIWAAVTGANPDRWFGHVSYIIMQDDQSYSWEGVWNWSIDEASKYTDKRSRDSSGMGYVLDFGSEVNEKFQYALKHAYDRQGPYVPDFNNCGAAFNRAINTISKEAGITKTWSTLPSGIKEYLEKNLLPNGFVKKEIEFPKH